MTNAIGGESVAAASERGKSEFLRDFLGLRPVVIRVTLEAARLGVIRPGRMASLASFHPWNQDVACFRTGQRFLMATHARESAMRVVIELRMRHPPQCHARRLNVGRPAHGGLSS